MEKYLFTDGTAGVKEVHSEEELSALIKAAAHPDKIRIWKFSSNEWINYTDLSKRSRQTIRKTVAASAAAAPVKKAIPAWKYGWLKKTVLVALAAATVFLIYNFTRIKWQKLEALHIVAPQPANVPVINADSLIAMIEWERGQKLDRTTKTNLRIRNTWPERILLHLDAQPESNNSIIKYGSVSITVDNATGYLIQQAVVKLDVWKNKEAVRTDTFHFDNTSYTSPARRNIAEVYKGDSISVSFYSIKAPSFNFCYSEEKESNYGNLADRWFCKE